MHLRPCLPLVPDFYDMKTVQAEGFSKRRLFEMLDGLESRTRPLAKAARQALAEAKGTSATEGWNLGFSLSGDIGGWRTTRGATIGRMHAP